MSEAPAVHVFYDYVCPYAFIGNRRARRLERQYDIDLVFLPWEIHAATAPAGEAYEGSPPEAHTRWLDRLADEVDVELNGPGKAINSNLALRGAEYAKDQGDKTFRRYHDACFDAVWLEGRDIGDPEVLSDIANHAGIPAKSFLEAIGAHAYQYRLDLIDEAAAVLGVQRVPTFVFGDQRIVGNDPLKESLVAPLEAFLERWKALGEDGTTTLDEDTGLSLTVA